MSADLTIVNHVLSAAGGVTALVPAVRIVSGPIALGSPLPAIGILHVTGNEHLTVSMAETKRFRWARVHVMAHAETYPAKLQILDAVLSALRGYHGSISGISVDSILPDIEGPDIDDPGGNQYERGQDFIVKWTE